MKRTSLIFFTVFFFGLITEVSAQDVKDVVPGVSVDYFSIDRDGKYLTVDMTVNLEHLSVGSNRAVLLTPRLVNGRDSLELPSIGVYGRNRYYYYMRNGLVNISGKDEISFRASSMLDDVDYHNPILYSDWMDGATLKFRRSDWGCCRHIVAEYDGLLGGYDEAFFPELVFVRPEAEIMKVRSLSGSAYVDFPVNQTVIYPDYRRNVEELGRIRSTIDSVRNDRDVTIVGVWLKGYASPESPYSHNTELAVGRTAALKSYICGLYHFDDSIIATDHEPEDWEGLRRYVLKSELLHRNGILEIIDSDLEPDAKEWKIRSTYPDEYRFMLQNYYPALRHTDYRIDYRVKSFSEVEEIKRIMSEQPQKLSLNEFYLVANTYEPGTDEFTEVFETAVRLYPGDETANLNAANAAVRRDDFVAAERYLRRAGESAEAEYARGALAIRMGDCEAARTYLVRAKAMGLEQASATLAELDKGRKK